MALNLKKMMGLDGDDSSLQTEDEFYTTTEEDTKDNKNGGGSKMILLEPRAYSESQQIADHLKKRNSVGVNLTRDTSDQAKRIIDFLSGCIYAIGGTMQKVGVGIYLCAPKNVNVQGKITEDSSSLDEEENEEVKW